MINPSMCELQTERLTLRKFREGDAQEMFSNYTHDDKMTKYLEWNTHKCIDTTSMYLDYLLKEYEKEYVYRWAIIFNGNLIGVIDAVSVDVNNEFCEIGYCIGSKWWGMGIMTEAFKAVLHYLLTEVGFNCVCARHVMENIASGRVMEKVGLKKEGVLRSRKKNDDGVFLDVQYRSILKSEYEHNL